MSALRIAFNRTWPRSLGADFLDRIHDARRVDQRRTGIYRNRDAERFRDFFPGSTASDGGFAMNRDAPVASRGDGDCEGDQLAHLCSEQILFLTSRAEFNIAPDGVGAELTDLLDACRQLSSIFIPVEHHLDISIAALDGRQSHVRRRVLAVRKQNHQAAIPWYLSSVIIPVSM
jgi:hypothetical protein